MRLTGTDRRHLHSWTGRLPSRMRIWHTQRAIWWSASRPWFRRCAFQIRREAEPSGLSHRHQPVIYRRGSEAADRRRVSALRARGGDPGGKLTVLRSRYPPAAVSRVASATELLVPMRSASFDQVAGELSRVDAAAPPERHGDQGSLAGICFQYGGRMGAAVMSSISRRVATMSDPEAASPGVCDASHERGGMP